MAEVSNNLAAMAQQVGDFERQVQQAQAKLQALDGALKTNQGSVDLVNQKYRLLNDALDVHREKQKALQNQAAALQAEFAGGTITQKDYHTQLDEVQHKSSLTEFEIQRLTGALKSQGEEIAQAQFQDITKGMQAAQEAAGNLTSMMDGLCSIAGIFGVTMDDSGNKALASMQKAVKGVSSVIAILPQLQKANAATATSYQRVATAATFAFGAVSLGYDLITRWQGMGWFERVLKSLATGFMMAAAAAAVFKAVMNPWAILGITAAVATAVGLVAAASSSIGVDSGVSGMGGGIDFDPGATMGGMQSDMSAVAPGSATESTKKIDFNMHITSTGDTPIAEANARLIAGEMREILNREFGDMI